MLLRVATSDASAALMPSESPGPPRPRPLAVLGALAAVFLALAMPTIVLSQRLFDRGVEIPGSQPFDEVNYHMPVVVTMAREWPDVDLVHYRSATSPGYHLALAAVSRGAGPSELRLRVINALLSLGLVLVIAWPMARTGPPLFAFFAGSCLVASSYVFGGAAYLTTDNAAMLFVALALMPCVFGRGFGSLGASGWRAPGVGALLLAGVFAALAVGVRQIHVWLAAPIGLAGLVASGLLPLPLGLRREAAAAPTGRSAMPLVAGALAAAMPFALLAYFVSIWGGIMPPAYRDLHGKSFNPALPALALATVGLLGVCFVPVAAPALRHRRAVAPVALGALVGLATALVPTAFNPDAGRHNGWLWQAVAKFPSVADRSLLILALAPLGGAILGALWRAAADRGRAAHASMLLLAMAAWAAAHSANAQAWLRYVEPMVLLALVWLAALAAAPSASGIAGPGARASRLAFLGPALLAAALGGMTMVKVIKPVLAPPTPSQAPSSTGARPTE